MKDGYKEGVWEYYDMPGTLALKIDYSSANLMYIITDTSEYVIKVNNEWIKSYLDMQSRYIGSMNDFHLLTRIVQYPMEARENHTCGKFFIVFEIDTLGKAENYLVVNDIGDKCSDEVIRALKAIPNYWISAQKNNKVYSSRFILPVTFKMIIDEKEISPKKLKNISAPPPGKYLDELIITAISVTRNESVRVH
jgi:hypothetical protein